MPASADELLAGVLVEAVPTVDQQLHLLEWRGGGAWTLVSSATMEHEVACIALCAAPRYGRRAFLLGY